MKQDIYKISKRIVGIIEQIKNDREISMRNKKFILDFHRYCLLNNLGKICMLGYLLRLRRISMWLRKDFDKVNKKDMESLIQKLHERNYKTLTKISFKVTLKRFYKWLKGNDIKYPKEVEWIKTTMKRTERHLPGEGDLITEDEVKKLIENAEHPRDKALISCLYESGCRIGELCSLCIKDIKFDEYGAVIHVSGKTGPRPIRLISSVPLLSIWINNHPCKDREAFVWICIGAKNHNKPLCYSGIYSLLRKLFKKSEISKKFNPHLFRHSRATYLANHLTEFQMNQYFGWVQGSGMPSTYVHLSGKNVDNAMLKLNGVKTGKKETKESKLKPKKCLRCDTVNSFSSKFCDECGCILDVKTAMELDERIKKDREVRNKTDKVINSLINSDEFQQKLLEKAKEEGISGKELLRSFFQ